MIRIKLNSGVMCTASVGDLSYFVFCIFLGWLLLLFSLNKVELQHHLLLLRAGSFQIHRDPKVINETPNHSQGKPSPHHELRELSSFFLWDIPCGAELHHLEMRGTSGCEVFEGHKWCFPGKKKINK